MTPPTRGRRRVSLRTTPSLPTLRVRGRILGRLRRLHGILSLATNELPNANENAADLDEQDGRELLRAPHRGQRADRLADQDEEARDERTLEDGLQDTSSPDGGVPLATASAFFLSIVLFREAILFLMASGDCFLPTFPAV